MATFAVGSRTKRKYEAKKGCANPLFEEWLIEWRDDAREKGHPTHFGFDRALKSLRQFPLPLKNGAEATQLLKFWGDKLGKMIDRRIQKYEEETGLKVNQGVSALEPVENRLSIPAPPPAASAGSTAPKAKAQRKKKTAAAATADTADLGTSVAPAPTKKKRATTVQEYVPQHGSGPYAILMALLKASRRPNYPGYMGKADIQRDAQLYATKSLTRADPGSYYTAWSSTGGLINKNLLTKSGCPARYALTSKGEELAERLEAVDNGAAPSAAASSSPSSSFSPPAPGAMSSCSDASSARSQSRSSPTAASVGSSSSSFSSSADSYYSPPPAKRKSPAAKVATAASSTAMSACLSPREMAAQAAIRRSQAAAAQSQSCASSTSYTSVTRTYGQSTSGSSRNTVIALSDDSDTDHEDLADHDQDATLVAMDHDQDWDAMFSNNNDVDDEDLPLITSAVKPPARVLSAGRTTETGSVAAPGRTGASSAVSSTISKSHSAASRSVTTAAAAALSSSKSTLPAAQSASTRVGKATATATAASSVHRDATSSATTPQPLSTPTVTLPAGTYDIILICDVCERRDGYSGQIMEELERNHVRFERRKLHVGDYVWIAQERTQPIPGQLRRPDPQELVLDYIIERKRMDDLAASIIGTKDRYREQKFRIAQSGLAHPIYLVEDYNNSSHLIGEDALFQALATTQVQDGYYVKHTSTARESAAYLTLMSRRLASMYGGSVSVSSCTKEELPRRCSGAGNGACHTRLLRFSDFNEMAIKNKVMSVSELFARQLMQVTGISAVRAASILELYPTPRLLVEAYENASGGEASKKNLLAHLTAGAAQRRFNSVPLYHLYGTGASVT